MYDEWIIIFLCLKEKKKEENAMKTHLIRWLLRIWCFCEWLSQTCEKLHIKEVVTPLLKQLKKMLQDKYGV